MCDNGQPNSELCISYLGKMPQVFKISFGNVSFILLYKKEDQGLKYICLCMHVHMYLSKVNF